MVLKSSLHIKYISRNPKHHLFLGYQVTPKNTIDGLFQIVCPLFHIGYPPVI